MKSFQGSRETGSYSVRLGGRVDQMLFAAVVVVAIKRGTFCQFQGGRSRDRGSERVDGASCSLLLILFRGGTHSIGIPTLREEGQF